MSGWPWLSPPCLVPLSMTVICDALTRDKSAVSPISQKSYKTYTPNTGPTHSESESLGGGERKEILSHLGHCWAKPAGAAPKGIIAAILRKVQSSIDTHCTLKGVDARSRFQINTAE